MILGMTGTRNDLTDQQLSWLWDQVQWANELHHGACVGADAAGHQAAKDHRVRIVVHPPTDERLMMPVDYNIWNWKPAKPYLDRNRDIVDESDQLIALPDGPEKPKGGTWYTVRYAKRVGKPVIVCYPDGTVESL